MAIIQKVKVGDEWVKVSSSNNSGSSSSGTGIFVINSDKDFEVIEDGSLAGIILDPNTTYNAIKSAIDNNYNIALKEPRGNLSYCLRADFVLEDEESGNKRIALFFTKSILTIRYDIILYIGLNNSILYMISKNDIFSKKEVEESIDNKAPYVGKEEPTTDTVLWIDPTGTPSQPSQPSGGGHILVYWYKLTDEQKAHNATAYQQILNEFKAGRFPQVIVANSEIAGANSMGIVGVYGGHPATEVSITDPDSQAAEMLGEISMGIRFSDVGGEKYLYITPDGVEHNYND